MGATPYFYRAYHLARDGHVEQTDLVPAADDHTALSALRQMKNGHGIELWDGLRLVGIAEPHCIDITIAAEANA